VALHQGLLSLETYRVVLVLGVERLSGLGSGVLTRNIAMAGDALLDQSVGLNFPATYALVAQAHAAAYGTSASDLDAIAFKNHSNAQLNPKAHFHKKIVTLEEIENAPMVASPLRLFDCCPVSDGAAAVVLETHPRNARSIPVMGSAIATDSISLAQRSSHTTFAAARVAAERAYAQAGVGPCDIDMAEVHDCFTIAEIVAMEDLGFAAPGDGARLVRDGGTRIGGRLPINMSGGLKAGGHAIGATGVSQACEIITQLRREAGPRQVDGAHVGLTHNVGGVGGTCAVNIFGGAR
jgi:acetyl-CoA C-acetyltransferase